jgi:DNA repair exonuclease SbcCD ATPase subunit
MSRADRKSHESRVTLDLLGDARNLFAEAVNDPERMPPLVRKFAQLQLDEVESRLALYEEMHSLRSQLAKAHQESQTAQRDRSEVEARMRHIDAALNEANAKLEAVMNIERDIEPAGKETFP